MMISFVQANEKHWIFIICFTKHDLNCFFIFSSQSGEIGERGPIGAKGGQGIPG